jgi:8-oxo-dGTP pyrophosphatase MutT (NUDIX family)
LPTVPHRNRLLGLLLKHQAADAQEEADRWRIYQLVDVEPDCFGERCTHAHITGSAFVLDPAGRLLLTHHKKLNRWLQVGGHSEPDEHDPLQTALREAAEESGLCDLRPAPGAAMPFDVDVHGIPARGERLGHDHHDVRYLLLTDTPEHIEVTAESHALQWVPLDALGALGLLEEPAMARVLGKVRAWWAEHGGRHHRVGP